MSVKLSYCDGSKTVLASEVDDLSCILYIYEEMKNVTVRWRGKLKGKREIIIRGNSAGCGLDGTRLRAFPCALTTFVKGAAP